MTLKEERDLHYECMAASGVSEDESPFPKEQEYQKNMKNYQKDQPKPHPHAYWIKLWADGYPIEYKACGKWIKVLDFNITTMPDIEYRIKPETEEPWKPEGGEKYFFLAVLEGEICVNWHKWKGDKIDISLHRQHNIFHTEEEAKSAIPRVIDSLKGGDSLGSMKSLQLQLDVKDAEIKKLKNELETLKICCKNLQITKEQLIASRAEIDALTDGELALIKALRLYDLSNITYNNKSVLVVAEDASGKPTTNIIKQFVAFYPDFADNKKVHNDVISALEKIKEEQEAE